MKSILLIGLGRFGRHIAIKLDELHHQVMAVDKDVYKRQLEAIMTFRSVRKGCKPVFTACASISSA